MKTRLAPGMFAGYAPALAVIACGVMTAGAYAVDRSVPYQPVHPINHGQTGTALIYPAQLHPNVAVDRTLSAQPVHPWMAHVTIGGSGPTARFGNRPNGSGAAMSTYIDPLQRIDGSGALDEGHSLVRAQRLHNQLSGMTTNGVAALRNDSLAAETLGGGANQARLIVSQRPRPGGEANTASVIIHAGPADRLAPMPTPNRRSVPIPAVPKPPKNDNPEKIASDVEHVNPSATAAPAVDAEAKADTTATQTSAVN